MATKNRIPLIMLVSVLFILGGVTLWRSHQSAARTGGDPPSSNFDASSPSGVASTATLREQGSHTAYQGRGDIAPAIATPVTREQRIALRKLGAEKSLRVYEMAQMQFTSQPVDPAWSTQAESSLRQLANDPVFAKIEAQPKDLVVGCKTSMCEIKGQFTADRQARDWTQVYMTKAATRISLARVRFVPNMDGTTQVHIYTYK